MSRSLIVEVNHECPNCKKGHKICVWQSYCVSFFNKSSRFPYVFYKKCPYCNTYYVLAELCLYHDPSKRYMVLFDPDTKFRQLDVRKLVPEFCLLTNYIFRLESDLNSALERVRLLSAGINDKLFEIFREFLFVKVKEIRPQAKKIVFHKRTMFNFHFLIVEADGSFKERIICNNFLFYKALTSFKKNKSNEKKRYYEMIDEQWVESCPEKPIFSDINFKILQITNFTGY